MNDKVKMGLLGLAVVVAIAGGVFAYQKMAPSNMNAYDPAHVGPPAYATGAGGAKGGDPAAYGASVGGKNAQVSGPGAAGQRAPGAPPPGQRPNYGGPH